MIDLAGSEKATSDKERTREGRYINTRFACSTMLESFSPVSYSLLTLGSVISTLGENAAKNKRYAVQFNSGFRNNPRLCSDHVPYRNSKLTRMLQPSLSGNARISVICTINPDPSATAESMSTLQFAQRIKKVQVGRKLQDIGRLLNNFFIVERAEERNRRHGSAD